MEVIIEAQGRCHLQVWVVTFRALTRNEIGNVGYYFWQHGVLDTIWGPLPYLKKEGEPSAGPPKKGQPKLEQQAVSTCEMEGSTRRLFFFNGDIS